MLLLCARPPLHATVAPVLHGPSSTLSNPRFRKTHGYRLFPQADDGEERLRHVPDQRRTGEHQGRGQALSTRQHRPATRHGQEDRLLADDRGAGPDVRARQRAQHRDRGQGRRPLPGQCLQAAWRSGHGDPRDQQRDPDHRAVAPATGAEGDHHAAARSGAGGRLDRLWKIDRAGVDDRSPQQQPERPHSHHRGSDRVPASAQEVDRQPARGRPGHPHVRQRAQERHARSTGCDPDR